MKNYVSNLLDLQDHEIWSMLEGDNPCKDPTVYSNSRVGDIATVRERCFE